MRILIVDDLYDARLVLRYMVENNGHDAIEADNGLNALETAKSSSPDLIISDALMPVMDGYKLLRAIKKSPELSRIPFVFYSSAYKGDLDVRLAMSLGANAYLFKPMDPAQLWHEIEDILKKTQQNDQEPTELIEEDAEYLRRYSEVVATKLEEKVLELEKNLVLRKRTEEQLANLNQHLESLVEKRTELLHAQKLKSIGQLAAGIAHEINNPIQYIVNNVEFLDDVFKELIGVLEDNDALCSALKIGLSVPEILEKVQISKEKHQLESICEDISGAFHDIFEGLRQIANIVGSVKRFAQPGRNTTVPADLNDAIKNTITISTSEWKSVAKIETDLESNLPLVPCNISDINEVLLSLILNAVHAITDLQAESGTTGKGTISLKTKSMGNSVEIRITDTGSGIPESIRARVFDPFFTTRSVGKGIGQGLAIARTIITENHQGTIDFETGVGKGTTFIIRLPSLAN